MKRQYLFILRYSVDDAGSPVKYHVDSFIENKNYQHNISQEDIYAARDICGVKIGQDLERTLTVMSLRTRFNTNMIPNILAVVVEDTEINGDTLEDIINNMSRERRSEFIRDAKI